MKNANTKGMGSKASKSRARLLTSWAAVIALAASLLVTACPQNPNKNVYFLVNSSGDEGYITGYRLKNGKKPGVLVIPDKMGDIVIIGLHREAFAHCDGLTKIDFSLCKNLTEIHDAAFWGCRDLTGTLVFPASLKTIKQYVFEGCTKLGGADFSACTGLTDIGYKAFKGCTGLKELKLPENLTRINRGAFFDCTSLTNITLPASLKEICGTAFSGCTGLTSVVFENKEGWAVYEYDNPYDTETPTPISPSDLADPSKAAKYLSETYSNKFWKRN